MPLILATLAVAYFVWFAWMILGLHKAPTRDDIDLGGN